MSKADAPTRSLAATFIVRLLKIVGGVALFCIALGKLFILSLGYKDYDILFVDMAIFTTISLLAGVVLDLSYGFIDPRIRMGAKK